MWTHPRICEKLFYNGHDPEKGCKGKSMGCENFHPNLCKKHIKGLCDGKNCQNGFHLRSINKNLKVKNDGKREEEIPSSKESSQKTEKPEIKNISSTEKSNADSDFLEEIKLTMKKLHDAQQEQGKILMTLMSKKEEEAVPEWMNQGKRCQATTI